MTGNFKVNYAMINVAHFGRHSFYAKFIEYLGRNINTKKGVRWPNNRIISLINSCISLLTGSPWYTLAALRLELSVIFDMFSHEGEIYHFLYGDTDCHYVASFNFFRRHRVIATYHQPPDELEVGVDPSIAKKLSAVILVASNQKSFFLNCVDIDRIFIVPLGVDTIFYCPEIKKIATLPTIISVGTHLRDFETLSNTISIVNSLIPEVRWNIVANPDYQEYFSKYSNVFFYHSISDEELLSLYRSSDLAVFTLRNCTANNALLEAMACGLPIVASDVGGIKDYVNSDCGILLSENDPLVFAKSIVDLLIDQDKRKVLGKNSRINVMKFDHSEIINQLINVYQKILFI